MVRRPILTIAFLSLLFVYQSLGNQTAPVAAQVVAAEPAAASVVLLVYPYLGNATSTSVTISWVTDGNNNGEVHFSTDQSYSHTALATSLFKDGGYWYSAALTGLSPDTTYYYRIFNGGADLTPWPTIAFTTSTSGTTLHFAAVSDSQPDTSTSGPTTAGIKVAAQMNLKDPDFILHSGDIIYDAATCSGSTSPWSQYVHSYFALYQSILGRIPLFPAVGNHEVKNDGGCGYDAYKSVFSLPENAPAGHTEEYYSFDWGNAHFVSLDSNQYLGTTYPETAWLINDLQSTSRLWKIVYIHAPPYNSEETDTAVHNYLVPIFETYGVDVVINGHMHGYERTCPILNGSCTTTDAGGVVYFTNAAGGQYPGTMPGDWFTAFTEARNEFLDVHINGCQAQFDAVDLNGSIFDQYSINKCGSSTPTFTASQTNTHEFTYTRTYTPRWTDTYTSTPTRTNTFTFTPTRTNTFASTVTGSATGFPTTAILDDFNRADGTIGTNWSIDRSSFKIAGNQMAMVTNGMIFWRLTSFGSDQEAFVNFVNIDSAATNMDLLLKSQSSSAKTAFVEVSYQPKTRMVTTFLYFNSAYTKCGASIPITFVNGDQLGARAIADGMIYIYKNGLLLGSCDASVYPYHSSSGYLGLLSWGSNAPVYDNFGGGTIVTTPTETLTFTPTATPSPTLTPTYTFTSTDPATPTQTEIPTLLETDTATYTPTDSPAWTITETTTETIGLTETYIPSESPTETPPSTDTFTPDVTPITTPTETIAQTPTPTYIETSTPTLTFSWTPTFTFTLSPSPSWTSTGTFSRTATYTKTITRTPTYTSTPTPTRTRLPTATRRPTRTRRY